MVGTTVAHYRVLERLGEGGMGEVYLVEDTRLKRRAALKLVSPSLTSDEERRQRFVQEARLAASIDHPHIAAIYDVGEFDGRTFIVMEYVDGRSLRDVLRLGSIPLRRALDYVLEAGDALAKVHERGVIHRDLKPENLLIAKDGYLKVIDFGLAKVAAPALAGYADAATMTGDHVRTAGGVVMGTIGYMSPEQVRGETVDARSDIFSFGAVFYEMVTGTAPFRRQSTADTISAILNATPVAPEVESGAVAVIVQRILRKCLAKEPAARYQSMRDLVVDLRDVRDVLASGDSTPPAATSSPAPSRARLQYPIVVGAAAIVVAGAMMAWTLVRERSPADSPVATVGGRPALAIVPFEIMGGTQDDAWLGKGLPSMLITGLAQTPDVELIGGARLSDAVRQLGASSLDGVERSRLAAVARAAGARYLLNGAIVRMGNDIRIDARVEDLTTGAVRATASVRGVDTLTLADDLAAQVRRGLDLEVGPDAVRPVAELSTASVDAYRAYSAGLEAEFNLRLDDARRMFGEAVRLDKGFGLAYLHLAITVAFEGRITESREWLGQAAAHLERMPERDAALVRAQLAYADGNYEQAVQLLEDLVRRYPDSEMAWLRLGFPIFDTDPERSRSVFERATAAMPHSPGLLNLLGYGQMGSGRVDDALRSFQSYVRLRPSEGNALDSLAEGYLVAGRSEEAISTFQAAAAAGYSGGRSGRALALAVMGRYDEALADAAVGGTVGALLLSRVGRYAEAERLLDGVRQQHESNGWIEGLGAVQLTRATYRLERNDCDRARRHVAAAEELLQARPPATATVWRVYADLVVGLCDVRSGQLGSARRRLEHAQQIRRSTSRLERWWVAVLEAEVALASGDAAAAERIYAGGTPERRMFFARQLYFFTQSVFANNTILRDGAARIAAAQGRTSEAIARYRRLLSHGPDQPWTAALEPRYVLALARLLEKSGDGPGARAEYRRFLELWKQADRDLPEPAEAHAALAR